MLIDTMTIQTADQLRAAINAYFDTNEAFLAAFKAATGVDVPAQYLSDQLGGRRRLTRFPQAAYTLFFQLRSGL